MKRVMKSVAFMFLVLSSMYIFSCILVNDKKSYTRLMLDELYRMQNIDYLFLGASRVYRGIIPDKIDSIMGVNSFNAGSSSQRPEDSYFLLKEVLMNQQVDCVVYDINYMMFQQYPDDSTIRTHILLDYFKLGRNKFEYAEKIIGNAFYGITKLSNIVRYKDNWKNPKMLYENILIHFFDEDYKNKTYKCADNDIEKYTGKGFVYSYKIMDSEEYMLIPWEQETIYEEQILYLKKIIDLCQSYQTKVILISVPVFNNYLDREENYLAIHNYFEDMARNSGIEYYDFNFAGGAEVSKNKFFFVDECHLNGFGAEKFSKILGKVLLSEVVP